MKNRILVTGATGAQGGASALHLLAAGYPTRVLVRQPLAPSALALAAAGAEVVQGDLEDPASVAAAMKDIHSVFSVQIPDMTGTDSERRHCKTLVDAAKTAGVAHFVHTSVAEAGKHTAFPRWESGHWGNKYWTDKWDAEETVRAANFPLWTVLKPAFMMDNFAQPKALFMFPHLRAGEVLTALLPETRMQLIAANDIGAFACAAFEHPTSYHQKNIDLAAEALTMSEIASTLSRVLNKDVVARSVDGNEAIASGLYPGWVRSQEWNNEVGYQADIASLQQYKLPLTSFAQWVSLNAEHIVIDA